MGATTMLQITHAAGVHQTTVSMALRDDPGISAQTRFRIRQLLPPREISLTVTKHW